MHPSLILSVIFGGSILAIATIGTIAIIIIKIIKGGVSQSSRKNQADDALFIQEIYQGLSEMEKRVDTLETILLEKQRR